MIFFFQEILIKSPYLKKANYNRDIYETFLWHFVAGRYYE